VTFTDGGEISVAELQIHAPNASTVIAPGTYQSANVKIYNSYGSAHILALNGSYIFTGDVEFKNSNASGSLEIKNSTNNPSIEFRGNVVWDEQAGSIIWTKGTGTITLSGATAQDIDFNDLTIEDIVINKDATANTVDFTDGWIADSFTLTTGTVDFNSETFETTGDFTIGTGGQVTSGATLTGTAITVGGNLSLTGESGDLLHPAGGGAWTLGVAGTASASYTEFAYCDASSGTEIDATSNCTDSGQNYNVNFGGTATWDGSESTDWDTGANWASGSLPGTGASVTIPDCTSINAPHLGSNVTVAGLTIASGGKLYLDGYNFGFGASGAVSNSGTIYLQGGETLSNITSLDIDSGTVEYIGAGGTATFSIKDFGDTDYYNLTINGAAGETFQTTDTKTLTVAGNLTLTEGIFDNATYDEDITVTGDVTMDNVAVSQGAGAWSIGGHFDYLHVEDWNTESGGTITLSGSGKNVTASGDYVRGVVIDTGASYTVLAAGGDWALKGLTVNGTLTIESGAGAYCPAAFDIAINTGGVLQGDGHIRLITPSSGHGLTTLDGTLSCKYQIWKPNSGSVMASGTYGGPVKIYNDAAAAHVMELSGSYIFSDSFELENTNAGGSLELDNSVNNPSIEFRGNVVWDEQAGTIAWTKGTGTITLSGSSAQTIDFNDLTIEDIVINKDATANTVDFTDGWTADSFTLTTGTVDFNSETFETTGGFTIGTGGQVTAGANLAGASFTVGGDLSLTGEDADLLNLVGTSAWTLTANGSDATASYVDVAYSDASAGMVIDGTNNCTDSGNNSNWDLGILDAVAASSVNDGGDTVTLTFIEAMDTSTIADGCSTLVIKYSDDGAGTNATTLTTTNSTVDWGGGNTAVTITLNEATDVAYIPDGKYVSVTPNANSVTTLSGLSAANTAIYTASAVTKEAVAPTVAVSASSVDAAGDTITLTFSEPMTAADITTAILRADTNITLDYSDNAGNTNQAGITVANAAVSWSDIETAVLTLDEATDGAYIPDGKFIGVTFDSSAARDLVLNAVISDEYYTSSGVSKETDPPEITVTAQTVDLGDDTVTISSNEVLSAAAAETIGNWTVYYDTDRSAGDEVEITTTNATASLDSTKKIVTITLNEVDDGAYLPADKYIKVTPNASNITDLAGNAGVAAAWTVETTSGDTVAPTFTVAAESVHSGGDTITLTFNEVMDTDTLTTANVNSNVEIDYSDNAGAVNQMDMVITNATVSWDSDKKVATITLNEETDNAYIPDNKFIGVTPVYEAVKDLAGNAAAASEIYTSAAVSKETTAPAFTSVLPASSSSVNDTNVTYTLSETVASGMITWTLSSGTDAGSPHEQALTGAELHEGEHSDITLTDNPTLVDGAVYTVKFEATDWVGNVATEVLKTNITYDVTDPYIDSVSVASNNATTTLAKAGDTVTYSITYSEAVTASVTTASTANNISTAVTQDASADNSASDSIVFTVASPDTGEITPDNINFTITDAGGNAVAITTLGTPTGSVTADTTLPTVTIVLSEDPTGMQDAGGLTFTLTFSETMDTGTAPTVTYDPEGAATGAEPCTGGTWSTTTNTNDTYTVTNDNAITADTGDGTAQISVTAAKDPTGNVMADDTDDTFQIVTTVLAVTGISDPMTAGDVESVTVTAQDTDGVTRTDYTGTITFTSSDAAASLPANYTFVSGDEGVHTFTNGVTLNTSGEQSVTATDTSNSIITGLQANITVNPGSTSYYSLNSPDNIVVGNRAAYTVTRYDVLGNLQTIGSEVIYLTTNSTGDAAVFKDAATAGSTITAVTIIGGASSANFWYYDELAGNWTITASDAVPADGTDGVDDATDALTVAKGSPDRFKITADSAAMNAGEYMDITITAYDEFYNVAASYEGADKNLTFSGASVSDSGKAPTCRNNITVDKDFGQDTTLTFTNGVATARMYLYKAELAAIKATDSAPTPDIETSAADDLEVAVSGGAASQLSWSTQPVTIAAANAPWKEFVIGVTDAYGNVATSTIPVTITPTGGTTGDGATDTVSASAGLASFSDFYLVCGAYPGYVTLQATASGVTESAASSQVTVEANYSITIHAKDIVNATHLDDTTLEIRDSGGALIYTDTGSSPFDGAAEEGFPLDYGTYTISLEKEQYVTNTSEKIAGVAADALDGTYDNTILWTIYVTSIAESTADYRVESAFVYDEVGEDLTIRLWLERRGKLVLNTELNKLGTAKVEVYDETSGEWLTDVTFTAPPSDDYVNGTYVTTVADVLDAGNALGTALVAGKTYFAKCTINWGGSGGDTNYYEGGTTFTVTVMEKLSREIISKMGVADGSTLGGMIEGISTKIGTLPTGKTLVTKIDAISAELETGVTGVSVGEGVGAILEDTGTTLPEKIMAEAAKGVQAGLLTRNTVIREDETITVRYRTTTGLEPTLSIYDADGDVLTDYDGVTMTEISNTGIYEYDITCSSAWGTGDFTVACEESTKESKDSMVLTVKALYVASGSVEERIDSLGYAVTKVYGRAGTIEDLLGTSTDDEDDSTVFGMVNDLEETIDDLGLTTVATDARLAKTKALNAYNAVSDIKSQVDNIEGQVNALQKLISYVEGMRADLSSLSKRISEEPAEVAVLAEETLEAGEKVATEAELAAIATEEQMKDLNNKVEELTAMVRIMRELMEAETEEPVVEGWFESD